MTMPPADLPLLVALLLGAAGVYLGLPRARPYPRGAAAACVALLGRVEQARRQETAEAALATLGDDFTFRQQAEALFQRTFGTSAPANRLSLILSQFDNIPTRPQPELPRLREWLDRLDAALR